MVLERYASQVLHAEQAGQGTTLIGALSRRDDRDATWPDRTLEDVVTAESAAVADDLDTWIATIMPAQYVTDPSFDFDPARVRPDLVAAVAQAPADKRAHLNKMISDRFESFGAYSRRALHAILRDSAPRSDK
jgi:hypothetical protein